MGGQRLQRAILTLPKIREGMGFPDPVRYYKASHLTRIMEWVVQSEPKLWVDLEQATIDSTLVGIPWSPIRDCLMAVTLHPLVGATFRMAKNL